MPLSWDDLNEPPDRWTLLTVPRRLERLRSDPWKDCTRISIASGSPGASYDWGMAPSGFLRRLGIMEAEATRPMIRAAEWARDQHVKDRLDAIRNTYDRDEETPTTGTEKLIDLRGDHGKNFVASVNQIWHVGSEAPGILPDRVDPATVDLAWERLVSTTKPRPCS
jgi:hypothetical protein